MINRKHYIVLFVLTTMLLMLPALSLKSQQVPVYSKYFMNRFLINPARTGAYGYTTVDLIAREKWLGME